MIRKLKSANTGYIPKRKIPGPTNAETWELSARLKRQKNTNRIFNISKGTNYNSNSNCSSLSLTGICLIKLSYPSSSVVIAINTVGIKAITDQPVFRFE
jgi:hypothetical protein